MSSTEPKSKAAIYALSGFSIAAGLFPLSIATGIFTPQEGSVHAPMWVLAVCGLVFIIGGLMVLMGRKNRANSLLAAVLCLMFAAVALWVALFGAGEQFSGGLPFVSNETNTGIGRWVFGFGGIVCLGIAGLALRGFLKGSDQ